MIGDALHNIADGLLLVASFGTSSAIGLSTALSIALHEAPQEISEFLVLKKSGYSDTEAAYRNFATALSIFIGIAIGIFLVRSSIVQAYLLGITATFFLGIVFTDLFPVRILVREQKLGRMSAALVLGALLMFGITNALGHDHNHEDGEHSHDNHPTGDTHYEDGYGPKQHDEYDDNETEEYHPKHADEEYHHNEDDHIHP